MPLDIVLRDESGHAVTLGDYFGKRPVVLSLVYYECPMLCTLTLNGLASALDVLSFDPGREFEIVTVSFEPQGDAGRWPRPRRPPTCRRYKRPAAAEAWHFLTGDAAQIRAPHRRRRLPLRLGRADEAVRARRAASWSLTADGRLARYLYGVEYAPKDLRLALVEASQGRIGSPVDRLLLYCYQYDPAAGRYGAVGDAHPARGRRCLTAGRAR